MRDRLIELLQEAKEHPEKTCPRWELPTCSGCNYNKGDECDHIARLADYLLKNGVIVPLCKVGDKVYKISRNKVKECEVVFIGISADEKCSHFNFVENYSDGTFHKSYSMVFDVIGKTVFLTKEEAEKALKEGADNVQSKT